MECAGCLKPSKTSNTVKCSSQKCQKSYCFLCVNITTITTEQKKTWKCPVCLASLRRGDNSQTPVRSCSENQSANVTLRKKQDTISTQSSIDLVDLASELRHLTKEFASMSSKLEDVTQSLILCHDRMDELVDTLKTTDTRLKRLEHRDEEVTLLRETVSELQSELNFQAQSLLRNEIEIVGIPETVNENLQHTILIAAKKLGVEIEDRDLDFVSRVGARSPPASSASVNPASMTDKMPRPVVVRLLRRFKRDQILKASKLRRNIMSTDLEVSGTPKRVYFNERLTKQNRLLFRESRIRAKNLGYQFCWCYQGAIYVKQREGAQSQVIRSLRELDLVLPERNGDGPLVTAAASAPPAAPTTV